MKALVFSDLHGHNFKEFSYIDECGINSRLVDQALVLNEIHRTAKEKKVDCVIFLGDWLHLKNNADSQVIKVLSYEFNLIAKNFPVYILPGNHDYRLWGSEPALLEVIEAMSDNIHILKKGWTTIHEQEFYCLPYTRKTVGLNAELSKLDPKPGSIFLGHKDIIGVKYGKFLVEKGLDAGMLNKKFRLSLIGHFHDTQKVEDRVFSVGAPMQHNFSDAFKPRGWWILETEKMKLDFIENMFSPKFIDIKADKSYDDELPGDPKRDFYRIQMKGSKLLDIFKQIRWKRVSFVVSNTKKSRSQMTFSDNDNDLIKKYVESQNVSKDLTCKTLIELGRKYL